MTCAVLLAALFPGVALADLDRDRVYEIPAAAIAATPVTTRWMAKACAIRHGIHWKIVNGGKG